MTSDRSVTAIFSLAPPPVPDCAGLIPHSMPPPIPATLPSAACATGTSDDGDGTFALSYIAGGSGPNYPIYLFFIVQDGAAVGTGGMVPGGDDSVIDLHSQPSGFTVFHEAIFAGPDLVTYDHAGNRVATASIAPHDTVHPPAAAVGIDPAGGTVTVAQVWDGAGNQWNTIYKRYDQRGTELTSVILDHQAATMVGIGVALSGNVLLIEATATAGEWTAQWMTRDGALIGSSFPISGQRFPALRPLTDGSVLVGFWSVASSVDVQWSYRIADGATATTPAPGWITERAGSEFWPIRSGRGYAVAGGVACGPGVLEIVTAEGESCGCMPIPAAGRSTSVGRDGSLIVPAGKVNTTTCRFDLYPHLFR